MLTKELTLVNKLGLHARAAIKFVDIAAGFRSSITIQYKNHRTDAKDILNVMALGASCGHKLTVSTSGEDEKEAMVAIEKLIVDRFGESN